MPGSGEHSFVFASLDSKRPHTARKVHIRRLYDILHFCIQKNDIARARRAWVILVRCKEIPWMTMWTTGLHILWGDENASQRETRTVEYLRGLIIQHSAQRETILKELIIRLVLSGSYREALEEIELYLPSFPYQDNPVLHLYAGLLTLHLAQPVMIEGQSGGPFNPGLLRDSQTHFERAKILDPDNDVANAFLYKIATLSQTAHHLQLQHDSDDDVADMQHGFQRRKRVRT